MHLNNNEYEYTLYTQYVACVPQVYLYMVDSSIQPLYRASFIPLVGSNLNAMWYSYCHKLTIACGCDGRGILPGSMHVENQ